MTPEAQAIIDNATALDTALAQANKSADERRAVIANLQFQVQLLQVKPLPVCYDLDFDPELKAAPGSVGNVGAKGSLHGTYSRNINYDGWNVWQFAPKHAANDPWDTWFVNRSFPYDAKFSRFVFKVAWRFPTPLDFDRCEQVETNWELQLPDYGTRNWGFAQNIGGSDGFKWFDFLNRKWVQLDIPYAGYATDLRNGKVLEITQLLHLDPDGNAVFDSVVLNGTAYPVNMTNPPVTRDNRKTWKPFAQWAWQADAKGKDEAFAVLTHGQSVVAY